MASYDRGCVVVSVRELRMVCRAWGGRIACSLRFRAGLFGHSANAMMARMGLGAAPPPPPPPPPNPPAAA
jgi:hypothetical protein